MAAQLGDDALAARLEEEAGAEERHIGQILAMLEGIGTGDPEGDLGPSR